jgi:hypothetical protein
MSLRLAKSAAEQRRAVLVIVILIVFLIYSSADTYIDYRLVRITITITITTRSLRDQELRPRFGTLHPEFAPSKAP